MNILESILLGIIQGITEWLPVSSSGHLVIFQQFLNIEVPLLFDILLHFATLIVIIAVFHKDILKILKAFPSTKTTDGKLGWYIIIGSIPIGLTGFLLKDTIASLFTNIKAVGIALLFTALLLFISEKYPGKRNMKWYDSIIIGISQALALIPGISRSGSTISTGLLLGLEKRQVATFSFLLVIPAILGATILEFSPSSLEFNYIYGFIATIVVGYLSLKWLLKLIINNKFSYFSIYCFIVGTILLII
jgi:undecaprenyl-diphosphatase